MSPVASKPDRIDQHLRAGTNLLTDYPLLGRAFTPVYIGLLDTYCGPTLTPRLVTSPRERTRPQSERFIGLSYRSQCLPPRNAPNEHYCTPQPDLRSGTTTLFAYRGTDSRGPLTAPSVFFLAVSRPFELSLQSSFQLSLAVLVRYRSRGNI